MGNYVYVVMEDKELLESVFSYLKDNLRIDLAVDYGSYPGSPDYLEVALVLRDPDGKHHTICTDQIEK